MLIIVERLVEIEQKMIAVWANGRTFMIRYWNYKMGSYFTQASLMFNGISTFVGLLNQSLKKNSCGTI